MVNLVFVDLEGRLFLKVFGYNMDWVETLEALMLKSLKVIDVRFATRLTSVVDVIRFECGS